MGKVIYFNSSVLPTEEEQLEVVDKDKLIRRGLIFYAGDHTDSKSRGHSFPEQRVLQIVENTNRLMEKGQSIPVLKDHNKTVDSACGHIEAPLEVRTITKEDLPNPRMTDLIGKLGVFCDAVVLKGKDVVSKFVSGAVKTVSPGIDVTTNTMRELSLTPVPAIRGLSLYKRGDTSINNADFAFTFDELEQDGAELDAMREEYESLTDKLWQLMMNIQQADEEELTQMQVDQQTLLDQAIGDFTDRLMQLFGGGMEEEMSEDPMMQPQQMQSPYQQRQMQQPRQGRFNNGVPLAAFSMSEMERVAEFGYRKAIGGTLNALANRKRTGKTIGQIGSKFGRTMMNATKGKIASVGRGFNKARNVVMGQSKFGSKLSNRQVTRATTVKNKFGVKGQRKNPIASPFNLKQSPGYQKLDKYQQASLN